MKKANFHISQFFIVIITALMIGCSSSNAPKRSDAFDGLFRTPKENIDIFMNGQLPSKKYKIIQVYSRADDVGKDARMIHDFVDKAKKLGADGIIINPPHGGGFDVGPLGSKSLMGYSATAIVYE